jgi:xanthine/CO dehydrogenase XdhC/CoxF family maturation factor
MVVYEPAKGGMSENLSAIKYKCGYVGLGGAQSKANRIKNKLQNGGFHDTPMLKIHPGAKN